MSKGKQKDKLPHYTDNLFNPNRVDGVWFYTAIDSSDGGYNKTYIPYLASHMTVKQWKNIKKGLYSMIDQINNEFTYGLSEEE